MSRNQFFDNPFCMFNCNYVMAWSFFFLSNSFIGIILFINPFKIDFTDNVLQFLLFVTGIFIVSILSRFICYQKKIKENLLVYDKI